jgi:hypothetical protein
VVGRMFNNLKAGLTFKVPQIGSYISTILPTYANMTFSEPLTEGKQLLLIIRRDSEF